MWSQARPTLWRYGDAGNLDPKRSVPLLVHEWITSLCLREEMEYDLDTDKEPFRVRSSDAEPEVNRFGQDWITLHLFATIFLLGGAAPVGLCVPEERRHEVGREGPTPDA